MELDDATCFRALAARDGRFDGLFFVGVTTTGIYCRPICPARSPGRARCRFFRTAAEAEAGGFRACFRCRPELAPGAASTERASALTRAAVARIEAGFLDERPATALAAALGVSDRHLRRAMEAELGVGPKALAQTRRLALAKRLLHDSSLSLAEIALASGFGSVRRFNAAFRERFGTAPSALRRREASGLPGVLRVRLEHRAPYDLEGMLAFLAGRAIPGVERVERGRYVRAVALGGKVGRLEVTADPERPALLAHVPVELARSVGAIVPRLRAVFDLDARPDRIAEVLAADPLLAPLVAARPGLRVPGAFDPFETAVRAVLGQQVTVKAATTLAGRLAARFGRAVELGPGLERVFPTAAELARAGVDELARLGMPGARAATIVALSRALEDGTVDLSGAMEPDLVIERLDALPGIGPWTAQYLAMRALHWPDAFPAGDLGVQKALGRPGLRGAEARAASWRPWRAYAVLHLWLSGSEGG